MKFIDIVELYVLIDDELKALGKKKIKELMGFKRDKSKERKLSFIDSRYNYQQNLKRYWCLQRLNKYFSLPAYNNFIRLLQKLEPIFSYLMNKILPVSYQGLAYVDSTKVETSKTRGKIHKIATKGYSSTGEFFGVKLHILLSSTNKIRCCPFSSLVFADIFVVFSISTDAVGDIALDTAIALAVSDSVSK